MFLYNRTFANVSLQINRQENRIHFLCLLNPFHPPWRHFAEMMKEAINLSVLEDYNNHKELSEYYMRYNEQNNFK